MYLGTDFLCWFPNLPRFLSGNAEEGFGSKSDNQKNLSTKPKTSLVNKLGQDTFEKSQDQKK